MWLSHQTLQLPKTECSEGMSSAELGSAIVPLVALGVRILGCRNRAQYSSCHRVLLGSFFLPFLYFLGSSSCPSDWMPLDHTTDLVLLWGTRWGRTQEPTRIFMYATQISDRHFYIPVETKATLSLQSAFKDLLIMKSVIFPWLVTCKSKFWRCFHLVTTVRKMCGSMSAGTGRTWLA